MRAPLSKIYCWIASCGLALQGLSTLVARLYEPVDKAFPALLAETQMVPAHSLLHIASAAVGFWCLWRGAAKTQLFALLFGGFYTLLAAVGFLSGAQLGLALQPFDHPFHLVLGMAGIGAAAIDQIFWRNHSGGSA